MKIPYQARCLQRVVVDRVQFTGFDDAYYARKGKIEELEKSIEQDKKSISIIDDALDESFDYCAFDEAKNNSNTSKYCSLKNELDEINSGFGKSFESSKSIPFFMFGAFVIIASCMTAGSIYMFGKRKEIAAFTTQQVMPVAKEGIDEMAPTIGNAVSEITKGIKKGLKDDEKK